MAALSFTVKGIPGAQGSKRPLGRHRQKGDVAGAHTGKHIMLENSKKVAPWRTDVKDAAEKAMGEVGMTMAFTQPVVLVVTFIFARAKGHYRSGKFAEQLKDSAPLYPTSIQKGDIDKLLRSTCDALTAAGVWFDDSQVVRVVSDKTYAKPPETILSGADITIMTIDGE